MGALAEDHINVRPQQAAADISRHSWWAHAWLVGQQPSAPTSASPTPCAPPALQDVRRGAADALARHASGLSQGAATVACCGSRAPMLLSAAGRACQALRPLLRAARPHPVLPAFPSPANQPQVASNLGALLAAGAAVAWPAAWWVDGVAAILIAAVIVLRWGLITHSQARRAGLGGRRRLRLTRASARRRGPARDLGSRGWSPRARLGVVCGRAWGQGAGCGRARLRRESRHTNPCAPARLPACLPARPRRLPAQMNKICGEAAPAEFAERARAIAAAHHPAMEVDVIR